MDQQSDLSKWYGDLQDGGFSSSTSLLEEAFHEARAKFISDLKQDRRKTSLAFSAASLKDVQVELCQSVTKYESDRKGSKAWKWLTQLSTRIHFYSSVLDVFAQHHPEYVALAWGSIKLLVVAVLNHEKVVATLAKALSQIADLIPHVELDAFLFPTDRMRSAIADLYSHILKFFIRALEWYSEGKFDHFIHSITRPVELRYQDLLDQISYASQRIKQLVTSGHLAEFRDMHNTVKRNAAKVEQISSAMTLQSSALIDTNQRISDLQFSNIMSSLSDSSIWNAMKVYQYHFSARRRRSHSRSVQALPESFWKSPKLRLWSCTDGSTLSIMAGSYQARFIMRNMCVDVLEQLYGAQIPLLLAMKVPETATSATISQTDLLRYLVRQALQLRSKLHTEKSMALRCATFHNATTEAEWFHLLEAILSEIGGCVYVIIDLEILDKSLSPIYDFSWIRAFEQFFNTVRLRGLSTQIKVMLFSYGSLPFQLLESDRSKFVIPVRTRPVTARQRKFVGAAKSLKLRL